MNESAAASTQTGIHIEPSLALDGRDMASSRLFAHPDDLLSDPGLAAPEKRAILASWLSDARAVENAPALRQLDSGAVVEVDALLQALKSLDGEHGSHPGPSSTPDRRVIRFKRGWWSKKGFWRSGPDDDDDPPPCPAAAAIPVPPSFLLAA